jgi:WD40 repeat protein
MADKKAPRADRGQSLDALLAHASETPNRKTWEELTALLDQVPAARLPAALKKAEAATRRWPLHLRSMPRRWWASIASGKSEPRAALARRYTLRAARDGEDEDLHLGTYALQVEMSPDRAAFVTADAGDVHHGGGDVVLWDARTGKKRAMLVSGREDHTEPHTLCMSPDGRWIAAAPIEAMMRGSVRLWDAKTGALVWRQELDPRGAERELRYDDEPVVDEDDDGTPERVALCFSPDGKRLWSASRRMGRLRCWDVATGASRGELPDEDGALSIALSPNGHLLATGSDAGWLRVWDLRDESLLAETRASDKGLWAVVFSSDGKKLASAGRELVLWKLDVETLRKQESHPLPVRGDAIAGAFSLVARPRGAIRAAVIVHGGVIVRDLPGRKTHKIKLESGLESIRLSRDGGELCAASTRRVRLFWLRG